MLHEYIYAGAVPWMMISGSVLLAVGWFLYRGGIKSQLRAKVDSALAWLIRTLDLVFYWTLDRLMGGHGNYYEGCLDKDNELREFGRDNCGECANERCIYNPNHRHHIKSIR